MVATPGPRWLQRRGGGRICRPETENYFLHRRRAACGFLFPHPDPVGDCFQAVMAVSLRRQVESNPHRLPKMWVILFPFVRNVVTWKSRRRLEHRWKLLKRWHI